MVFIRLIVKVYPREQLSRPYPTPNRKPPTTSSEHETKPASFLLALPNPEETSLGELARLIRSKWAKLRPNAEPLDIKKLLDDSRDMVDLDVDMTVADVWVNQARAKRDEDDQVGTVRVVQRPAPYAPVRFPSVDQDWGVTKEEKFRGKFETIEEAGETETDSESGSEEESEEEEEESEGEKRNLIDAQARAVNGRDNEESETDESEEEDSRDESDSGSEEDDNEQVNGRANVEGSADEGESEEESAPDNDIRMEDSLPETRVLKRKMSTEELEPRKQPRLAQSSQASAGDAENVHGTPVSSPLGTRKRDADRAPSFSGLGRRLSFTERPALSHGLGLGITKSPPRKQPFLMADLLKDSTQSESGPSDTRVSPTSVPPSSAPAIRRSSGNQHPSTPAKLQTPADKVRLLQSALRKDSPAERSPERRSVSFAEGEDHAVPTSVPVTRATSRVIHKEQKNGTNSGSKQAPPEPEEPSDKEEEFSTGINLEINEYERALQTHDLDEKSEYTRKVKLAAKKWQIMKNNKDKGRKRMQERYKNAVNDLRILHRDIVELWEFNKPPSPRPKSQIPNGTPATKKLSRDPTSSQNRKSQDPWDVEILTPRADSKKLIPKNLPHSQTSRKSSDREEAQAQQQDKGHQSVEIPPPKAGSSAERRLGSKKLSQERPPSPPSESESEAESEKSGSEEESTAKQPERKKSSSQEKSPSPPAGSESEDESGSEEEEEEEEDNAAPNQADSLTNLTSTVEASIPDPVPESGSGSDSEEQSGSDEEDEDEDEEKQGEEEEKDRPTDEESQNKDADQHEEKEKEMVQEPETQKDDIVPETEEEREQETTTPAQSNPPPTETLSKPNPAEETESDADEESDGEEEEESDNESDKENRSLPKPASTAKANVLRRTSLNPPSSQPNPPSSQQQPTSSQSTPTGSRPTRNTLKSLLFQQRAEQAQARLKKEEEAAKRKSQPRKDIFSGPSDSESEDEDESSSSSSSSSESESGADAGDILSSGRVGKLRAAIPRK
ncbi:conserved serine-rich protein [Aspergillus flavus]|nr:conserved serine-rich protein [Aspergillus flavus]